MMRQWLRLALASLAFVALNHRAAAQDSDPPPDPVQEAPQAADLDVQYNALYASANTNLWYVNAATGAATLIGPIGFQGTDIAFAGTQLYGISFSHLLWINPTTGAGQIVGPIGFNDVNGLAVALDGTFYGSTISGKLIKINSATGAGVQVGTFGPGYGSSGDLAFREDGVLFASLNRTGYSTDWLVQINLANGAATPIGNLGYATVYGLSFRDGQLYGVTASGHVLRIDTATGVSTLVSQTSTPFWGLGTSWKALNGHLTSPQNDDSIGPATIQLAAEASYPGGNGVKQVEFYAFYDRSWHSAGTDTTAPYIASWQTPNLLASQQLQFRIDVVGNDNVRTEYAGGIRRVNYFQSLGNPAVSENWIPVRAYLNQRSLSPVGDWKCNVSSMAMVLASEGKIGFDYQSMANKANEMYPQVLIDGWAHVYLMRDELRRQGVNSDYFGPWSADTAWPKLKAEIDAGHAVIVGPGPAEITPAGHFVVAVGYREYDGRREMITYDPFGRWKGVICSQLPGDCSGNYDLNVAGDPTSHKGQWVYYDWPVFVTDNRVRLITAHNPSLDMSLASATPSTPPDVTSNEPETVGTYIGIPFADFFNLFIPIIH